MRQRERYRGSINSQAGDQSSKKNINMYVESNPEDTSAASETIPVVV